MPVCSAAYEHQQLHGLKEIHSVHSIVISKIGTNPTVESGASRAARDSSLRRYTPSHCKHHMVNFVCMFPSIYVSSCTLHSARVHACISDCIM
jgi:hypothetical protein